MTACRVLSADPPWRFRDALPGKGRGASKHYSTLTIPEICRFPLPPLADDAWLFLWRVASMQQEAFDVVRCWGFTVKTELVWEKTTSTGRQHFGMGRYLRASHETCLVAVRGRPRPAVRNVRTRFAAPVAAHSAKPDAFYGLVETLVGGGPYVELFARRERSGWDCYGDQLGRPHP